MTADHSILIAILIGIVSLLYATAGQAGGTAFLAVMGVAGIAPAEMRPSALLLNIVAAGYATWRLNASDAIDWKTLRALTIPSLVTAFVGGLIALEASLYFMLTGGLLIAAAAVMLFKRTADSVESKPVETVPATLVGGGAGLLSGLSGVGGGVFLVPQLVALGWKSPKAAAALSPPFILCNSILGLIGVLLAGQKPAQNTVFYAAAAVAGAIAGTAIGTRWMSEKATRYALAFILVIAGARLLLR